MFDDLSNQMQSKEVAVLHDKIVLMMAEHFAEMGFSNRMMGLVGMFLTKAIYEELKASIGADERDEKVICDTAVACAEEARKLREEQAQNKPSEQPKEAPSVESSSESIREAANKTINFLADKIEAMNLDDEHGARVFFYILRLARQVTIKQLRMNEEAVGMVEKFADKEADRQVRFAQNEVSSKVVN